MWEIIVPILVINSVFFIWVAAAKLATNTPYTAEDFDGWDH